ncbi:hypothetical protein EI94DRAFT_1809204 [Lactarius quietus]|nr:hypothetical protein EI94DRAFT_1809204 [Lactarius quietus]
MPTTTTTGIQRKFCSLAALNSDSARAPPNAGKVLHPLSFHIAFTFTVSFALVATATTYSAYVYIGRLCIPMIKRESRSLGSCTMGIVFLVVFALLGMMMIWAYIKLVFTPPGYAIEVSSRLFPTLLAPPAVVTPVRFDVLPHYPGVARNTLSPRELELFEHPLSYVDTPSTRTPPQPAPLPPKTSQGSSTPLAPSPTSHSPPHLTSQPARTSQQSHGANTPTSLSPSTYSSAEKSARAESYATSWHPVSETPTGENSQRPQGRAPTRILSNVRYVIGQCVGAQNEKFCFVAVVWGMLFCQWTFSTLVGLNARAASRTDTTIDPQHIVVIVLSGLSTVYWSLVFILNVVLISTDQTAIEYFAARSMKNRERMTPNMIHPSWGFAERQSTRQAWNANWGRVGREGNMWWLGDMRAHWEQVLGPRTWMWLLPIGSKKELRPEYPRNFRFAEDGRWMPRKEWPTELQ